MCSEHVCVCFFFFFKQKTAYEIGTGDWSSDVCSSDLAGFISHLKIDEKCEMEVILGDYHEGMRHFHFMAL